MSFFQGGSFAQNNNNALNAYAGGSFMGGNGSLYPSFADQFPQGSFLNNGQQMPMPAYEDIVVEQTQQQTEMYESVNRIEDFDAKNEENLM